MLNLVAALLLTNAQGEESSILDRATVSSYGLNLKNTWHPNALIDGNFVSKTVLLEDNAFKLVDGTSEFTIILD